MSNSNRKNLRALYCAATLLTLLPLTDSSAMAENAIDSIETISTFNGNTGLITACVGLYDETDNLIVNANNEPETYDVQMQLFADSDAPNDIKFQITSATPSHSNNCSGRYKQGIYSDAILIDNANANLDGTVLQLNFNHETDAGLIFALNTAPDAMLLLRDLNANTTNLGENLGSFSASSRIEFNTVNIPIMYSLTAPQCSDPNGDTNKVIVELDSQQVASVSPGQEFQLSTQGLSEGEHLVKALCSDENALNSSVLNKGYGNRSGYANGSITLSVSPNSNCTQTITALAQNLSENFPDNIPSWEQLSCFISPLQRRPNPSYLILAGDTPPPSGDEPGAPETPLTFWESIELELAFIEQWPEANFYDPTQAQIPPFYMDADDRFTDIEWDQKLRGIGTYVLLMKHLGYRSQLDYFTPPSSNIDITHSAEEFLSWWQNSYIPERVDLARLAEIVQAEYYQPWDIEPGQFVRAYGDLWLEDLSEDEQITLAQELIDSLYDAVRPEFSGTLVITNYDRFSAVGDHWKRVDLSQWDQIHFSLYTEGDVEGTEYYLAQQLSGYEEMIERDNLSTKAQLDIVVNPSAHQALLDQLPGNVQFADIEVQIYQSVFSAIEDFPALNGLGISVGNIVTSEAKTLVRQVLANAQ
ncbi:MAG: hypothetical protein R3332_12555 [Pseudohongiellaceae bacterium]|nr:hypothetical protein [Pseudohongiellaceae bacterium]